MVTVSSGLGGFADVVDLYALFHGERVQEIFLGSAWKFCAVGKRIHRNNQFERWATTGKF
jgi:hypothetical protein